MKNKNHTHSKKTLVAILSAGAVLAVSYFIYHQSFIPGLASNRKIADELKKEITALKGNGIEDEFISFVNANSAFASLPGSPAAKLNGDDIDINLIYKDLETSTDGKQGIVHIIAPELEIYSVKEKRSYFITAEKFAISKSAADRSKVNIWVEGAVDIFSGKQDSKDKTKTLSLTQAANNIELTFDGQKVTGQKIDVTDMELLEARSNMRIFTIKKITGNSSETEQDGKFVFSSATEYEGVAIGDMLKLFVGDLAPFSIKLNYDFSAAENKTGALNIKKSTIVQADAALELEGKLEFKADNEANMPHGMLDVKLINYPKIISLFGNYYHLQPQDAENFRHCNGNWR